MESHQRVDDLFSRFSLDDRPGYVGVGLDEGAALVVQGSHLKAIGRSSGIPAGPPPGIGPPGPPNRPAPRPNRGPPVVSCPAA